MDRIFLDLGFIKIYWYSLMLFIAFLLGSGIILKKAKRYNIDKDFIVDLIFYTIPISLIGARIYFVIFNFDYYGQNLLDIFKVWEGGLAIHGGIIAGLIFVYYYTKKKNENFILMIDIISISLILGQAIGRWGNFFNQEAHGGITTLNYLKSLHIPNFIIEGMYINGNYYLPTFLYESIWCLLGFIILNIIISNKNIKVGTTSAIYLIWYGMERFIVEGYRTDSLMLVSFKMAQIVSIIMIIIGIIVYIITRKERKYGDINESI